MRTAAVRIHRQLLQRRPELGQLDGGDAIEVLAEVPGIEMIVRHFARDRQMAAQAAVEVFGLAVGDRTGIGRVGERRNRRALAGNPRDKERKARIAAGSEIGAADEGRLALEVRAIGGGAIVVCIKELVAIPAGIDRA